MPLYQKMKKRNVKKREGYEVYQKKNDKRYKSDSGAILQTDETSPDVIARIATVPERKSNDSLNEAMVRRDRIIKKGDVIYLFPDTYIGNNVLAGTGGVNKLYRLILDQLQCQ